MKFLLVFFVFFVYGFCQSNIIEEKECQYKDKFFDACKHYKTKYVLLDTDLVCTQECQQWDSFFQKCMYETACQYDANNQIFIQTRCQEWDSFFKQCKTESKKVIKPKGLKDMQIILKRENGN